MIKRLLGSLAVIAMLMVPASIQGQALPGVLGSAVDNTPAPFFAPPCTTFGYSVDATATLPTGFNNGRQVAFDEANRRLYVMTVGNALNDTRLCVFTADSSLTQEGCLTLPNQAEILVEASSDGVVNSAGQFLFFFRKAVAGCSAGGFACVGLRVFNGPVQIADIDFGSISNGNIDAARYDPATDLVWLQMSQPLISGVDRVLQRFNGTTFADIGVYGTLTGLGSGLISAFVIDATDVYGADNTSKVMWKTSKTTFSVLTVVLSVGTRTINGIVNDDISSVPTVGVTTDNDAGAGFLQQVRKSDFFPITTLVYLAADAGANTGYQIFRDLTNNRFHSIRENGSTNFIRGSTAFGVGLAELLLRSAGSFTNNAHTTADYSRDFASLYTIDGSTPAILSKIKICATGGP